MDLELLSFLVIGLLALAVGLVTFARAKTSGWLRLLLITIAYFLMLPAFLGMMVVIFRVQ
jgi:hypothetical protein